VFELLDDLGLLAVAEREVVRVLGAMKTQAGRAAGVCWSSSETVSRSVSCGTSWLPAATVPATARGSR
jgi:hypothetical protein